MWSRKCSACKAKDRTIQILEDQLRLANMARAQLESRRGPLPYQEIAPLHSVPGDQMLAGLDEVAGNSRPVRRIYSEEGTEYIEVELDSGEPPA